MKINVITLGCSKNLVDSEFLLEQLRLNGIEVYHEADSKQVDALLINTCGFIHDAKEESLDEIFNAVHSKAIGKIKKIVVFGCLSERYKKELTSEIPEVDAFFGVDDLEKIVGFFGGKIVESSLNARMQTTPGHYAYLKISEGCNWACSYCAIPLIRGKHKSKSIESLVEEAEILAKRGVKELLLIAQDLTFYGIDLYGKRKLYDLLLALECIEGIEWIRLHYAYPSAFPEEIIPLIKRSEKICNYLDMPIQHISSKVLKMMKRGIDKEGTLRLLKLLKTELPDMALRTTILVGHPGEEEEDFQQLKQFIQTFQFDRLGVFTYSEEEDTYSAKEFTDDVPAHVKQNRLEEIMEIQSAISNELNQKKVGSIYKTIIDRKEGDFYIGRTEYDSPEVDNEVLISSKNSELKIGTFYMVKIVKAEDFDLYGEIDL